MAQYKGAASEGSRAMQMLKKREKAQEEVEFRKKKIEEELKVSGIKDKFATHLPTTHFVPLLLAQYWIQQRIRECK